MPDFRISKVSDIARNAKTFLSKGSNGQELERLETKVRGKRQELERLETKVRSKRQLLKRLETKGRGKRQELERLETKVRGKRQLLKQVEDEFRRTLPDLSKQVEDEFRRMLPDFEHYKDQPESLRYALKHVADQQKEIIKNQQLRIFRLKGDTAQLKRKLRTKTGKEPGDETPSGRLTPPNADEEPAVGALPDFLIIGAQKCGTTTLYDLLTRTRMSSAQQ